MNIVEFSQKLSQDKNLLLLFVRDPKMALSQQKIKIKPGQIVEMKTSLKKLGELRKPDKAIIVKIIVDTLKILEPSANIQLAINIDPASIIDVASNPTSQ